MMVTEDETPISATCLGSLNWESLCEQRSPEHPSCSCWKLLLCTGGSRRKRDSKKAPVLAAVARVDFDLLKTLRVGVGV